MKGLYITLIGLMLSASTGFASDNWSDDIKLSGDLRYRHELIEDNLKPSRNRHRIRARLGIKAKINEYASIGFQLASGSDDPISTNQSLDGGFSSKELVLNQAYFEIKHHRTPGLSLTGGKFKAPFFRPGRTEMVWDGDLGMEGGYLKYKNSSSRATVTVVGAGLWLEERSSSSDSYIGAGQAIIEYQIKENRSSISVAVGYFGYVNAQNHPFFFDDENSMGNSSTPYIDGSDTILTYANEYELYEISAQLNLKLSETPLVVYGDFVTNGGADSLNTGYLVGFSLGKAKKPGSWGVKYYYRELEKDAVVGAFSNSDFGGGGTNAKGHKIGAAYQLADNTTFALTYFVNQTGIDQTETKDYNRLQVDLKLKF